LFGAFRPLRVEVEYLGGNLRPFLLKPLALTVPGGDFAVKVA